MSELRAEADAPRRVLVVEDGDGVRRSLVKLLNENGYSCVSAATASEAQDLLDRDSFDLVLTNMEMPELINRAQVNRLERMVRDRTADMWRHVAELETTQREMRSLQEETIHRLSLAAEFRDDETPRHIQRMSHYCALIADRVGLDADRCELIRIASALHDVGKIGVPDHILMKPGALDEEERSVMQRHCEMGHRILSGSNSPVLSMAATIALTHHERFDGGGYPNRLSAGSIPLEGRIAAIADVFDALTTDKVYSAAISVSDAVEVMKDERGRHFDPTLLDVFLAEQSRILGIKDRFADLDQDEAELNPLTALVADL